MQQDKVFVIDIRGNPLLPTCSARARLLLAHNKANVECVLPFTIRLCRVVEDPVGQFGIGIDDGSRHVGIAIVNDLTHDAVFVGEIELRQDVKRLVRQRAKYRRARRSRNLRHRKKRVDNRIGYGLAPSIRARKDTTLRCIEDMQRRVNITHATVEEVSFNHVVNRWGKQFSLVETGKAYLRNGIVSLGLEVEVVEGWMTANWRKATGTPKSHGVDAAVILGKMEKVGLPLTHFVILPRRTRVWRENPTKKHAEYLGFCHWDVVKAVRAHKCVVGCVRSLKVKALTLRICEDNNFPVSYTKSRLLWRPGGLVYLPMV